MNTQKLYKGMQIAELSVFALATIFVFVFQLTGLTFFVTSSLVLYSVGFFLVMIYYIYQAYEVCKKRTAIKADKTIDNKESELKPLTKAIALEIVKACAAGAFAIFTFIVLLLY